MRLASVAALFCLAVASVWYLIAPPRGPEAYRERAAMTAESLRSQVQNARLWLREVERGNVIRAAATVALEESETDALSAVAGFEALDPPPDATDVRSRISDAGDEVTDVLGALRIAAHDGDWPKALRLARRLPGLAREIEALRIRVHA